MTAMRVSESFTHKMAAWEICLQDGGDFAGFTHKMAVGCWSRV